MRDKVIEIVQNVLEVEINENTSQEDCENWDSIAQLRIIVDIENEFDTKIEPEEMGLMTSIESIVNILENK